jgi:hypothetical protein
MNFIYSDSALRQMLAALLFAIPALGACSSEVGDPAPAAVAPPAASNEGLHAENRASCDSWRRYFAGRACNSYNSTKETCDAACIGVDTSCQLVYDAPPEGNYCAHAGGCQGGLYACHAGTCSVPACHFPPGDGMDQCSLGALTTFCDGSPICKTAAECASTTP